MSGQPTEREILLAAGIKELEATAAKPVITGGGWLGEVLNFISARVPRVLITTTIVVFLGVKSWDYYNLAQQMVADLEAKRGDVMRASAEAGAQNTMTGDGSMRFATLTAQLAKTEAEAKVAKAEAEAQMHMVGDASMRLATLQAELEKTEAEALQAKTEANALNQMVERMPLAVGQKQAEVEDAEAKVRAELELLRLLVNTMRNMEYDGAHPFDFLSGKSRPR